MTLGQALELAAPKNNHHYNPMAMHHACVRKMKASLGSLPARSGFVKKEMYLMREREVCALLIVMIDF